MHLAESSSTLFVYGLVFRFRLLSTPPLIDAVTFSYGQASVPVRRGLSPFCWCVLSGAPFMPLRGADRCSFIPSYISPHVRNWCLTFIVRSYIFLTDPP